MCPWRSYPTPFCEVGCSCSPHAAAPLPLAFCCPSQDYQRVDSRREPLSAEVERRSGHHIALACVQLNRKLDFFTMIHVANHTEKRLRCRKVCVKQLGESILTDNTLNSFSINYDRLNSKSICLELPIYQ